MTQPRKEQVKNLKTKYTRFTGVQSLSIGGGPVQTVMNTALEAFYDNLLSVTKTGAVGGAETSAPAILYGGSGPFPISAGDSMSLTISGVNGGNPMPIVVQADDVVTLGGSPVVTTSRLANRINAVVASHGVTGPVAENVGGQIVLKSYGASGLLTGDSVVMTLSETTSGLLNVLGFSPLGSVSGSGTTAPKRGIVTVSADGLGGVVQLRKVDAVVPDALGNVMRHAMAGVQVPEVVHGQPVYARMTAFPGPVINGRNIRLSFFRNGPVRPRVVTSQGTNKSNFATLTAGDSITVNLDFGNGQTLSFNVTFPGITTVQSVVDRLNSALSTASLSATSGQIDSTKPAVLFKLAAPYRFTDPSNRDSFFFSFNGAASIHFNPAAGNYSASQLVALINSAIAAQGQSAQGQAFSYTAPDGSVYVGLRSLNSDVTASSVRIMPGNPGGSAPAQYMGTLDMLGLVPGTYRAGTIAELYGNDEIEIHCPSPLPNASLVISGGPATMAKLGLPPGVSVMTTVGVQPVVAPTSHALIPEMVEFHEERDDYDTIVQDFDNKSAYAQLRPQDGASNVGLDQLIGSDGKILASLIPRILDFIGADQLRLGGGMLNNLTNALLTPKIQASHTDSASGYATLLFESSADSSSASSNNIIRVYISADTVFVTNNARIVDRISASAPFSRDFSGKDSSLLEYNVRDGVMKLSFRRSSDSSPWGYTGWKGSVKLDPKAVETDEHMSPIPSPAILKLGAFLTANSGELLKPRIGTHSTLGQYMLLYEGSPAASQLPMRGQVRIYAYLGLTDPSRLYITTNAKWDGAQFSKDISGFASAKLGFGGGSFVVETRDSDGSWDDSGWEKNHLRLDYSSLTAFLDGSINLGSAQPASVARVSATRSNPAGDRRTLLFESPSSGPSASIPIRLYILATSSTYFKDGFEFTYNARWDQNVDGWVPDDPLQKSFSWVMSENRFYFLSKNATGFSTPWSEDPTSGTGWSRYNMFDHQAAVTSFTAKDGVFQVIGATTSGSNPFGGAAVLPNTLYAKSMIKSWGKIRGDGPSIFNISLMDGFNCSYTGYDSLAGAYSIQFATSLSSSNYALSFGGRSTNGVTGSGSPSEPSGYSTWVNPYRYLYGAVVVSQYTNGFGYYPLTSQGTGGSHSASLGDILGNYMYYMAVGPQTS